jgi:hypothetical protein
MTRVSRSRNAARTDGGQRRGSAEAAAVASIFASVLASVDPAGHDGGGPDDRGGPGDGGADDTPAGNPGAS